MQDPLNPNFEAGLDAALRRPPEVRVPEHFRQRLLARAAGPEVEKTVPAPRTSPWVLPALALAGAATIAALGITVVDLGLVDLSWMRGLAAGVTLPSLLLGVVGIESVATLAWVWHVYRSAR